MALALILSVALLFASVCPRVSALDSGQKLGPGKARPQPPTPAAIQVPFRVGEKLNYRILWSKFSIHAGTLRLIAVERGPFYGAQAWHFQAVAHTVDSMRVVYTLDDQFDSYTEQAALTGLQYEVHVREQGKQQDSIFRMSKDGDPAPASGAAVRVSPGTRDPIGLIYYLRAVDWQRTKEVNSPIFDGHKLYEVKARLQRERGEASVPAGNYTASSIEVRVFEHGADVPDTHFWLWLAQDAARTPVLIEAEVPLGTARVELTHAG